MFEKIVIVLVRLSNPWHGIFGSGALARARRWREDDAKKDEDAELDANSRGGGGQRHLQNE